MKERIPEGISQLEILHFRKQDTRSDVTISIEIDFI